MSENDAQFVDENSGLPSDHVNYNPGAELRKSKQAELNGGAGEAEDIENDNPEASIRQSKLQNMMKGATGGILNPPGSPIDMSKLGSAGGAISGFFLLPESTQIEIFMASWPETFGLVIPIWDVVWIWGLLFSKVKPKVGPTVTVMFVSLVFWIAVLIVITLILTFFQIASNPKAWFS